MGSALLLSMIALSGAASAGSGCATVGFDGPIFASGRFNYRQEIDGDEEDEEDQVDGRDGGAFRLAGALDCDMEHDVYLTLAYIPSYAVDTDDQGNFSMGPVASIGGLYEHKVADMGPVPLMLQVRAGLQSVKPAGDYEDLLEFLDESERRRWGVFGGAGAGTRYLFGDGDLKFGVGGDLGLAYHQWWLVDFEDEVNDVDVEATLNGGFLELRLGVEGRIHF
jgi:hypothetical protein